MSSADSINTWLGWLPDDTETFVVARGFSIRSTDRVRRHRALSGWAELQYLALNFASACETLHNDVLVDQKVSVAINGGRRFETTSSFGAFLYEGCSIVVLDLQTRDDWDKVLEALRRHAIGVEHLANAPTIDVFRYPYNIVREPYYKPKTSFGMFVAVPQRGIVLCATNKEYLQEVLDRSSKENDMAATLRGAKVWQYVDPSAPAFCVRILPAVPRAPHVASLAWVLGAREKATFMVSYLPASAADRDIVLQGVRTRWAPAGEGVRPKIGREASGVVGVTIDTTEEVPSDWYAVPIMATLNESGAWDN